VVLAIDPDIVEMDRAVCGKTDLGDDTEDKLHEVGMHNLSPTGILGDPTKSTAEAGRDYIEAISTALADQIRGILEKLDD
jgi:creatinine amidohydrolase